MAENEWYDKYKKDVTAALTKSKSAPRDNAIACTLVKARDGSFLLCANVSASKQTAMVQAARSKGAKVVSTGILFLGDQGVSFEVTDGDASVAQKFSAAAVEAIGKPMKVHVVAAPEGTPPGTPPSETPPETPGAFMTRAQAAAQALRGAAPKAQEVLKPRLAQAIALAKEGKLAEASTQLGLVEKALASLRSSPPPSPPPSPPVESVAPTPPSDKAQFTQRLQEVKGRYAEVLKTNPPNRAALEKAMGMVVAAARENDFARGLKVLDALDRALKTTPSSGQPTTTPETPPQESPTQESTSEEQQTSETPDSPPETPTTDTVETWVAALDEARKALGRLEDKLASADDENTDDLADAGFDDLLDALDGGLTDALGDFDAARDGDRESATKKAVELLAKQRRLLLGDELVGELDANPFGVKVGLRDALTRALNEVEKELKA